MRKPEQRLWDTMRRVAPPELWLERVENAVGDGTPDVHCGSYSCISWVELKVCVRPARETTRMLGSDGLRPSQINWHLKAASLRMPVYTLVRDDMKELYLLYARHAAAINEMSRNDLRAASMAQTWPQVFDVIMRGMIDL